MTTAQKTTAGFVAALLILLVGALSWRRTREVLVASSWVEHTHEVIASLESVRSDLIDMETGQRGYLLTRDSAFLQPYDSASRRLTQNLEAVRRLIADNPRQQEGLQSLETAIQRKRAFVGDVVSLVAAGLADSAARAVRSGEGNRRMVDVRRQIDGMQQEEQRLLDVRTRERLARESATSFVIVAGSIGSFALVSLMIGFIRRDVRLQQRTAAERDALLTRVSAANTQLAGIQQVTDAALGALALDDLLDELMTRVRAVLHVDTACVLLITRDGAHLELCKCVGVTQEILDRVKVPVGEGVEGEIAAEARARNLADLTQANVYDPVVRMHFASMLGAPLVVQDRPSPLRTGSHIVDGMQGARVIGVVHVLSVAPRVFTPDEEELLALVAERAASAIERARLLQAERRSEERFHLLVDSVRDYALFMLDEAGNVSSWNAGAERMFGHSADAIVGKPLSRLYDESDSLDEDFALLIGRARTDGSVRHEGWRVRSDGSRFWADATITALHDEDDGGLIGFAKVTRDLTEQRRFDEALVAAKEHAEAANAAKSQFLATMSHEIRTPINAVLGYTQLLDMGLSGPVTSEQRAHLTRVEASARHLLGLVNELLDLAKIEAQQLRVERIRASMPEAASEAIALIFPQANARGLTLSTACVGGDDVSYTGDPHRVEQILVNLLSNAVKFTNVGGRIAITCGHHTAPPDFGPVAPTSRWCYVSVADTGIGIPADQLGTIFDPFTQANRAGSPGETNQRSSYSREHGGTGLGLTISRRLARLMGGDVTVESTLGAGTTFTLWLPAPHDAEADALADTQADTAEMAVPDRRTGSRESTSLAIVGRVLRDRATVILTAHVARLRSDVTAPNVLRVTDLALEDHLDTLLSELALSLTTIEEAAGQASIALRDGAAIQKVLAQRHGAQRASLGWREEDVGREVRLLHGAIESELRKALSGAADVNLSPAMDVLANRLDFIERYSREGWRARMLPDGSTEPLDT